MFDKQIDTSAALPVLSSKSLSAWVLTCVSTVCLALVMTGSSLPAYAFVACWIPFCVYHARASVTAICASPTIWVLPSFALLSTIWSQAPAATLRSATELSMTFAFAMILAKILTPRLFISAALCGLSIIAIVALSVTGFVVDPLSGSVDFVGPFASKNQLAFFVALLWLTGFTVLIDGRQPGIFRTLGALCFLASGPLIILARSATSDLTAGASLLALIANLGFSRLNVRARARGIFAVTIISLPAIFLLASLEGDLQANVLALLGKDQTLTGRTILWQRAFELIPEHPWLGQGFKAFWREGYVEAESLWAMFGVRGGFHFHDTLIETTIEIGYVGAALLLIFVGLVTFCVLAWSWQKKSIESSYFVAILFLLLVRSIVEVDVPSEFSLATFVLVMAAQYGFSERAGSRFALAKGAHALELQNVLARQRQEHRA